MEQQLKLVIGCDFAAYDFKTEILENMKKNGYQIVDVGCDSSKEGLYAPVAKKVADAVAAGEYDYGILLCGTGQGMAMAANKVPGIRAVLCYDVLPAVLSKEHNHGNILCTGAWMMNVPDALRMIEAWLFAKYAGNNDEGVQLMKQYEREGR
ncbi:ribose 5-phosphate isomerase B [Aequitasia blattaphilus]|uniref:RpiB/LacA/LacB family sugar-phosphate isomerase n=1 Tax=Aequitasia blattaphilus TaxID=2949332 RepID=A0ABT1EA42_9FIRM|nr:RpiB/LacA/LacB family sugar-phosphate isomerase [Aequitasia blattaphilus]MCP1102689.1 RpiB/LacA/LacB family sugar-phosphate isomerase [Aequitasia blattaphilus]MCR8615329.1 RpiB/LacA/LacB family sugar-phosphate isomerase [Aequitasia blattaphilus]